MKILILVSMMILIGNSMPVFARGNDGGGGKGVLCIRDGKQTLTVLDLYEASAVWGYAAPQEMTEDQAFLTFAPKIYKAFQEQALIPWIADDKAIAAQEKTFYQEFLSSLKFIPDGATLEPTTDATIIIQPPKECQVVQVLKYMDGGFETGTLLADRHYWNLLSPMGKMAFYYHEVIYKDLRDWVQMTTSDQVRKLIGLFFSSSPFPFRYTALESQKSVVECDSVSSPEHQLPLRFFVLPHQSGSNWSPAASDIIIDTLGEFAPTAAFPMLPVEYRAVVPYFTPNSFVDGPSDDNVEHWGTVSLQVSSIFNWLGLELTAKQSSDSSQKFSIQGLAKDGSKLSIPLACKKL